MREKEQDSCLNVRNFTPQRVNNTGTSVNGPQRLLETEAPNEVNNLQAYITYCASLCRKPNAQHDVTYKHKTNKQKRTKIYLFIFLNRVSAAFFF